MKKGAMKIASASVFSEAAPALPIWNTMRNPSAFLRKLSLNAEKNWHQNSGAKRRDVMRFVDMVRAFSWSEGAERSSQGENERRYQPDGCSRVRAMAFIWDAEPIVGGRPGFAQSHLARSISMRRRSVLASSMRFTSLALSCTSRIVLVSVMHDWISMTTPIAR